MKRRDLIISIVFLNIAATILLAISAIRTKDHIEAIHQTVTAHTKPVEKPEETKAPIDQIDHLLKEYVQPVKEEEMSETVDTKEVKKEVSQDIKEKSHGDFKEVEWVVRSGDVLEKIARRFHVSVDDIKHLNHLKNEKLSIGQVLRIRVIDQPVKKTTAMQNSTCKFYTVRTGDSLWTIAIKHHMKVEDLLRLNNMNEKEAKRLKPGDQIRIE